MSPCPVCRSNRGVERISPAPPVHEGRFWLLEPDVVRSFCAGIGEDIRRRLTHGGTP